MNSTRTDLLRPAVLVVLALAAAAGAQTGENRSPGGLDGAPPVFVDPASQSPLAAKTGEATSEKPVGKGPSRAGGHNSLPSWEDVKKGFTKAEKESGAGQDWSNPIKLALVFAGLAILPSLLVMLTSFTRIVIVLAFVRRALSTQSIPPTIAIIGLALFLTLFTMAPTFGLINDEALQPYLNDEITFDQAAGIGMDRLKEFMLAQTRESDLNLFLDISGAEEGKKIETVADVPTHVAIPAFAISEFRTAFEMGCLLFIPFLLIDVVVGGILLSTGMMMLPPSMISLPFKIILFVLVDGWRLLALTLVTSFHPIGGAG